MELILSGISKSYQRGNFLFPQKRKILCDISMSASCGDCIGILGANGSGKSTLLSILAGVKSPDSGTFLYNNTNLFTKNNISSLVAYVPQQNPLVEELNAYDNLLLWYSKEQIKSELENGVLKLLDISSFLHTPVSKMSGGMQKRLSIACAVAKKPKILLLDEPSAALDLICKEKIYSYFKDFTKNGGIIIIITHEIQELELCSKLFILRNGVLIPYTYNGNSQELARELSKS